MSRVRGCSKFGLGKFKKLKDVRCGTLPSRTALKVGVASSGRFHLLDLARELDVLGVDVRFYSFVSRKRAKSFGLPAACHVPFLPILFPIVALDRIFPWLFPHVVERLMCWMLDLLTILRMKRCDVFICMSGIYLLAPRYAKWRYGAQVHLHRSSQHILAQKEILASLPRARKITLFMERRELEGYGLADQIIVPSTHVVESFARWPECSSKVFLNPLGVDIRQFPLRRGVPPLDNVTVLFVGQWSYRKGVDILTEAIRRLRNVRLVHVGALSDAPFPADYRFSHYDHVPQQQLASYYAAAHIFVLPSREDGFGVVLSQSLSVGVPVVCTDRTGGPDLARMPGLSRFIRIVVAGESTALRLALEQAIREVESGLVPQITEEERRLLGWENYAARTLLFMNGALATQRLSFQEA